jgi:hypothetical protein
MTQNSLTENRVFTAGNKDHINACTAELHQRLILLSQASGDKSVLPYDITIGQGSS